MNDTTETNPEAVVETTEPETAVHGSESDGDEPEGDGPVSRQAAKFRKRTRELEAELAAATETITALRRERAEDLAAEHGLKPDALWATTELGALLGESGSVDPVKVREVVETAVASLGVTLKPRNGLQIREGIPSQPPSGGGRAKWDAKFRP